mmetsp:Transcript_808/g.1120  ORF Transcript_808/g.1120 Transcript_808/m.1120 type:complete len:190 (+) Transcript_808:37-606(+)
MSTAKVVVGEEEEEDEGSIPQTQSIPTSGSLQLSATAVISSGSSTYVVPGEEVEDENEQFESYTKQESARSQDKLRSSEEQILGTIQGPSNQTEDSEKFDGNVITKTFREKKLVERNEGLRRVLSTKWLQTYQAAHKTLLQSTPKTTLDVLQDISQQLGKTSEELQVMNSKLSLANSWLHSFVNNPAVV